MWVDLDEYIKGRKSPYPEPERKVKLYADEDIEDELVDFLRSKKVNIKSARELGHTPRSDSFHANYAFRKRRFILTKNGKHYLPLPWNQIHGVIVIHATMANMANYSLVIENLLSLVNYGDTYHSMKIAIYPNTATFRYPTKAGKDQLQRLRYSRHKIEVLADDDCRPRAATL